ncbi:MAG TPA: GNAT family N-acetyltransferase [Candidatus Limnocylindria bacterium]|nr:GNAT family N-acetyltransferase [Candidatus Limnocylindria bacterium]
MNPAVSARPAGRELLLSLKEAAGLPGPPLRLVIGQPPVALLRVVATQAGRIQAGDIRYLTEWRNRFVTSFLTEFTATEARTEKWLAEIVGPADSKILFMVDAPDGRTFGYMGLAFIDWAKGCGEADAIVRGGDAPPGTMRQALVALLLWARHSLGLSRLGVRVRSDNPALNFYQKLGFVENFRTPLLRTGRNGETVWVEDPGLKSGDPALVHMAWNGQTGETK